MGAQAPNRILVRACCVVALGASVSQCHSQFLETSTTSSRGALAQQKSLKAVTRGDIQRLFKASSDFVEERVFESLGQGRSSCKTILSKGSAVEAAILPWPAELKEFLADLVEELPSDESDPGNGLKARVVSAIDSVFLVSKDVLQGKDGAMAAGLACDRGEDNKGVIFLNEFTFVTDRMDKGLKSRQSYSVIPSPYLVIKSPDNAAVTFLHEAFHALDNKYFKDPDNRVDYDLRNDIHDLSWLSNGEPRYQTVAGLDLASGGAQPKGANLKSYSGCRPVSTLNSNGLDRLGLAEDSPQDVADRLQQLKSKTNFIVPYTQANPAEDFAESLAVYYFGRFHNDEGRQFGSHSWQRREVYEDDLRQVLPRSGKVLQIFDTQTILRNHALQRVKMCKLAALVFREDEEVCLEKLSERK